jgi:hypothetical protein
MYLSAEDIPDFCSEGCCLFALDDRAALLRDFGKLQDLNLTEERRKMDESSIDREAMAQLVNALTFICGADHPTVAAMKKAVASGTERDIRNARTQFLKLKASDRRAALAMLKD